MKEFAPDSEDYPDEALILTHMPPQLLGTEWSDVPGGWTECFIRGSMKRAILATPGFPQDPVKPPRSVYRLGPTPFGVGMFATRDLSMGDHILSERPLMISPIGAEIPGGIKSSGHNFSPEELRQVMLFEWEKMLEMCFKRLQPENQAAFMALANSHTKDGSGPVTAIIRTNGFEVNGLRDPGDPEGSYIAVCKIMSRINHRFVVITPFLLDEGLDGVTVVARPQIGSLTSHRSLFNCGRPATLRKTRRFSYRTVTSWRRPDNVRNILHHMALFAHACLVHLTPQNPTNGALGLRTVYSSLKTISIIGLPTPSSLMIKLSKRALNGWR